ncbi:hypothetical protein AB0B50_21450 [Streptomyces sp. NPDC041068]|uniref:hypothetical protein n=1 Tax=Streptomyces sp. NPDC041068 TaxID=3155130 RepID=UPI003405C6A9
MQGIPHIASTPHDGRWSPVPPAHREQYAGQDTQYDVRQDSRYAAHDMTQPVPYQGAAAPYVAPVAPRPQDDEPQLPVFIDESGWRRRALQGVALAVGLVCIGYLLFVGVLFSGLMQPVGTHPPRMNGPVPAGPDTGDRPAPPPAGAPKQ